MDRFFWAVDTDLPTEDPQIRYRLSRDDYEGRVKKSGKGRGDDSRWRGRLSGRILFSLKVF
jgi:hypothetical protein